VPLAFCGSFVAVLLATLSRRQAKRRSGAWRTPITAQIMLRMTPITTCCTATHSTSSISKDYLSLLPRTVTAQNALQGYDRPRCQRNESGM
jgi:hypothetical protein